MKTANNPIDDSHPTTVKAGAPPPVQTIIYVHGIGNKPEASVLKCQWDNALFGCDLGDRSRMVYWVNREFYPVPSDETCRSADALNIDDDEISTQAIMALSGAKKISEESAMEAEIAALTHDTQRSEELWSLANRMIEGVEKNTQKVEEGTFTTAEFRPKILPLPEFMRGWISQKITRAFLRDVHDFLFREDRRKAMEETLRERLRSSGRSVVVIAHSQGSLIAYNVLRSIDVDEVDERGQKIWPEVRLFVTIGSPLGLQEVQDELKKWGALNVPSCVQEWVNVADKIDPVSVDADIAREFEPNETEKAIKNHAGFFLNLDSPRHPHSATGYLRTSYVKEAVLRTVSHAFVQPVAKFVISMDLATDLENSHHEERHPVLIQLASSQTEPMQSLKEARDILEGGIKTLIGRSINSTNEDEIEKIARFDRLRHFLAADLTRSEVEMLRLNFKEYKVNTVWRNAKKGVMIHQSTHTVQVKPANLAYGANGEGIGWAVLDTGIRGDHPHFAKHKNIVEQWDCTKPGIIKSLSKSVSDELDGNGHGTHVAAIIAGELELPLSPGEPPTVLSGLAPKARLYGFKVLGNNGDGSDATIIKALDKIAEINESAGRLIIHGVNISLGGPVNPEVYNCGFTPICQELRRLWGQGVLVCIAAGNEGYAILSSHVGDLSANLDLTIGDPANLAEGITVGSVNKTNPHTYGVSYFSSRGPTADGRSKPDLVAPGEQILSAWNDWHILSLKKPEAQRTARDLYIEMSGTSMAAPHVSGLLASFLSMRREFIGYPDRVKNLLLETCTDLDRDKYVQGYGMPNLIKMLVES
ncbi:MAG: S8 family peptidase [Ignavibacteriae bacterium]|nr:S8 family peptidase [Ignavibacteriota bacterium]MCB9215179.1 S8 family peptidase [Ignavibacteria bacterium]